ncbi:MAG: SdrD B-like domain-containing protein [Rhodoferax sp.]
MGDRVWYDKNANGIQDQGEAGVAGVRVELRSNGVNGVDGGTVLATTTTDANGNYLFTNLTPGGYHIDIDESTLPSGFIFTKSNIGSDAADSDVRSSASQPLIWGIMDNTTLVAGEDDRSWDAGVYKVGIDVEKYVSGTVCTTVNNCSGEGQTVSYWKSNASGTAAWATTAGPAPASSTT